MTENLYNRFIDAFRDANETLPEQKRSPLISDEKLEDTLKTIKKSLQDQMKNVKETTAPLKEEKSSRFQRWVMHYLKAPFQKWKSPKATIEQAHREIEIFSDDDDEEENVDLRSSSPISDDDDDDDDVDEDEDEDDEDIKGDSTVTERVKQRLDSLRDQVKSKVCEVQNTWIDFLNISLQISPSSDDDDEDEDEDDDDDESSSVRERLAQGIEKAKSIGEEVTKKVCWFNLENALEE